jgi:hypothetical protein
MAFSEMDRHQSVRRERRAKSRMKTKVLMTPTLRLRERWHATLAFNEVGRR